MEDILTASRERVAPDSVEFLLRAVRQSVQKEGLRPFANRTGIPLGQLRSVLDGRAPRYTTLRSIASVMGMRLLVGPVERGGVSRSGPQTVEAVRMMPFAEGVRFDADAGELELEASPDVSIAVADRVLPGWARAARLTCVRVAGDAMAPTIPAGALAVVDQDRRQAVHNALFMMCIGGKLAVRRLRRRGRGWVLVSDNPTHPSTPMTAADLVVGRVAWPGPHGDAEA